MPLGLGMPEVGLIVALGAFLVLRSLFAPAALVSRRLGAGAAKRTWREWTWWERAEVGLAIALLAALWIYWMQDLGSWLAAAGLLMVGYAIRALHRIRTSQHRTQAEPAAQQGDEADER